MVGQKVGDPGGRELDRGVSCRSNLPLFLFGAADRGVERFI